MAAAVLSARRAVEPDRDRSVIDKADLHIGAENAGLIRHPLPRQGCREMLVQALALIGRAGGGKAWSVAAQIRREGELATALN